VGRGRSSIKELRRKLVLRNKRGSGGTGGGQSLLSRQVLLKNEPFSWKAVEVRGNKNDTQKTRHWILVFEVELCELACCITKESNISASNPFSRILRLILAFLSSHLCAMSSGETRLEWVHYFETGELYDCTIRVGSSISSYKVRLCLSRDIQRAK
jgi:hypothetical protein